MRKTLKVIGTLMEVYLVHFLLKNHFGFQILFDI